MLGSSMSKDLVSVKFYVYCQTNFGQLLYVCGNTPTLGLWNPLKGLQLQTSQKTYPKWELHQFYYDRKQTTIQFKFVIIQAQNVKRWEYLAKNRTLKIKSNSQITAYFGSDSMQIIQTPVINIKCREGTYDILNEMSSDWGSSVDYSSNYKIQNFFKMVGRDSGVQTEQQSQKSSDLIGLNQIILQPDINAKQPVQTYHTQHTKFLKINQQQKHENRFKLGTNKVYKLLVNRQKSRNRKVKVFETEEHSLSGSHRSCSKYQSNAQELSTQKNQAHNGHISPVLLNVGKLQSFISVKQHIISNASTAADQDKGKANYKKKNQDSGSANSEYDNQDQYLRNRDQQTELDDDDDYDQMNKI